MQTINNKKLIPDEEKVEGMAQFEYLRSLTTWDIDCSKDTDRRIAKATGAFCGFRSVEEQRD